VTDISFKYLEKKHSRKVVGQKIWPIEKKRKHRLKVRKTEGSPNRGGCRKKLEMTWKIREGGRKKS
jgi:hypothetical protein